MKRMTHTRRGARQIRSFYFWAGVSYPTNVARLRYSISDALIAIAPIF